MTRSTRWSPPIAVLLSIMLFGWALGKCFAPAMAPATDSLAISIRSLWCIGAVTWLWLALATTLSTARRLIPALRDRDGLDWGTPHWIRGALDRIAAVSIVTLMSVPLSAAPVRAANATNRAVTADPYVRGTAPTNATEPPHVRGSQRATPTTSSTTPTNTPPVAHDPKRPRQPTSQPNAPAGAQGDRTHIVERGDNLWSIARDELAQRGHSVTDATTAVYWAELIRVNRSKLRSGNPSLIFIGEVIELPL